MKTHNRRLDIALALGLAAFLLLPWYRIDGGFFGFGWLSAFPEEPAAAPGSGFPARAATCHKTAARKGMSSTIHQLS